MVNQITKNPRRIETRYFVTIAIGSILERSRIDFELYRPEMEDEEVDQIVQDSGFNSNFPYLEMLINHIKKTFTLSEIIQFMGCLSSIELIEMKILPAVFQVCNPFIPDSAEKVVRIPVAKGSLDFSTFEQYSLPFVIAGHYNPRQYG